MHLIVLGHLSAVKTGLLMHSKIYITPKWVVAQITGMAAHDDY